MNFKDWIFDLDNTLYPASSSLFPQIEQRMGQFITETLKVDRTEAHRLQKFYYRTYGTTLRGLMEEHGLAPDEFLAYVHEIDCTVLQPDPRLDAALQRIPGRKLIYTNGSERHAENVLRHLGLGDHFAAIYDIKAADYLPKPAIASYRRLLTQFSIEPERAVMFEDLAHNLTAAAELGMTTVWVKDVSHPDGPMTPPDDISAIHHETNDLAGWLDTHLSAFCKQEAPSP